MQSVQAYSVRATKWEGKVDGDCAVLMSRRKANANKWRRRMVRLGEHAAWWPSTHRADWSVAEVVVALVACIAVLLGLLIQVLFE